MLLYLFEPPSSDYKNLKVKVKGYAKYTLHLSALTITNH